MKLIKVLCCSTLFWASSAILASPKPYLAKFKLRPWIDAESNKVDYEAPQKYFSEIAQKYGFCGLETNYTINWVNLCNPNALLTTLPDLFSQSPYYENYPTEKNELLGSLLLQLDRSPRGIQQLWLSLNRYLFKVIPWQEYIQKGYQMKVDDLLLELEFLREKLGDSTGVVLKRSYQELAATTLIGMPDTLRSPDIHVNNGWASSFWSRRFGEGNEKVVEKILKNVQKKYSQYIRSQDRKAYNPIRGINKLSEIHFHPEVGKENLWNYKTIQSKWPFSGSLVPWKLEQLQTTKSYVKNPEGEMSYSFQDFKIQRNLHLRQIHDLRHPRIFTTWWVLYHNHWRGKIYRFRASDIEGKLMGNYNLERVESPDSNRVLFYVRSEMSRPNGFFWTSGKILEMTRSGDYLEYKGMTNRFFFQTKEVWLNQEEQAVKIYFARELKTKAGYEGLKVDMQDQEAPPECSYQSPFTGDPESNPNTWERYQKLTDCMLKHSNPSKTFRALNEPAFNEQSYPLTNTFNKNPN